jgi:hypothetical protein
MGVMFEEKIGGEQRVHHLDWEMARDLHLYRCNKLIHHLPSILDFSPATHIKEQPNLHACSCELRRSYLWNLQPCHILKKQRSIFIELRLNMQLVTQHYHCWVQTPFHRRSEGRLDLSQWPWRWLSPIVLSQRWKYIITTCLTRKDEDNPFKTI